MITQNSKKAGNIFLVFDLGGGTFDISLIRINDDNYEVLDTDGDAELGGSDFDELLLDYYLEEAEEQFGPEIRDNVSFVSRLRYRCEKAKVLLSSEQHAVIRFTCPGLAEFHRAVFRSTFDQLCAQKFDQCMQQVDDLLQRAKLSAENLTQVLLVGGSTRIPKIQQMLRAKFGNTKVNVDLNVDEVVAKGACLSVHTSQLLTITAHSLGTDCLRMPAHHTYVLIDKSGSMLDDATVPSNEDIYQRNLLGAVAERTIQYIAERATVSPHDLISVIAFNHEAMLIVHSCAVTEQFILATQLNEICPGGGTSYQSALQMAFQLASNRKDSLHPMFVMMSDGLDGDDGQGVEQLVSDYFDNSKESFLETIGFGNPHHFEKLRRLSSISGGDFYHANDRITLDTAFAEITFKSKTPLDTTQCIIPKGTRIPCSASHAFGNAETNQERVNISVVEGESEKVSENSAIGRFEVEMDPRPIGQSRVDVLFEVDNNGILQVTATSDGQVKSVVIDVRPGVLTQDELVYAAVKCRRMLAESNLREELKLERANPNGDQERIEKLRNDLQDFLFNDPNQDDPELNQRAVQFV
ncbi:hypothetical protein GEMRC1_013957 [Eukaryota sp. GEM-RC1]